MGITETAYYKTKTVKAELINASGALPVGCRRLNGKIVPALSPVNVVTRSYEADVHFASFCNATHKFYLHVGTRMFSGADGLNPKQGVSLTAAAPFILEERENGAWQARLIGDKRCVVDAVGAEKILLKAYNFAVRGGILKSGRLFAADLNEGVKLRWSGEGGSADWVENISGAGWLYLSGSEGNILELAELDGNIIAVREHGLTVISAYGTPENFKVLNVIAKTHLIYGHTVAVAGGKLLFCTQDGVYSFNGNKTEKLKNTLDGEILTPEYAAVSGNTYFYCGTSKSLGRSVIVALDISDGEAYIIDFPAQALVVSGKLFAYSSTQNCLPDSGGGFSFKSGAENFGTLQKKTLKYVDVSCGGRFDVEVECDGYIRRFYGVKHRLTANMCGVNFKVTVFGRDEISGICAVAEV